ncbi:uncharacterized protein LOC119432490 [Dermacentor silvarum]|uniref:uncharacterized protein LOC119432490 n=1 Tax=Dermacentor silvarum TaxID=543639 RepID=UPI0018970333|nr:uncharacterized protein LOC119432490 [Dermacentor silvarum]
MAMVLEACFTFAAGQARCLVSSHPSTPIRRSAASGLLNIDCVDAGVFRTYFRFEKNNIGRLKTALLIPDTIYTAQRITVSGEEALCLTLRRLAYPNRLSDLECLFGRHYSVILVVTNHVLGHIESNFGHLLRDVNNHKWLDLAALQEFSHAVHSKGAPLTNCWGFIDGTARPICRPSENQKIFFSGHKRTHAVKYQSIMCPNGIIAQLRGPYYGSRHDSGTRFRQMYKLGHVAHVREFLQGSENQPLVVVDIAEKVPKVVFNVPKPMVGHH